MNPDTYALAQDLIPSMMKAVNTEFAATIRRRDAIPEDRFREYISAQRLIGLLPPDARQEVADEIIRQLESHFMVKQDTGSAVTERGLRRWLSKSRENLDFWYWRRLEAWLSSSGKLPAPVIRTLEKDSEDILDLCGDPRLTGPDANRRGLVVGHVQAGKTTSYSALICMAADAGYRVVVVLAGLTNSLRSQTQERLDESFLGRTSEFALDAADCPIMQYGDGGKRREPAYGTTRTKDFNVRAAGNYGVSLSTLNEPILFVLKKNPSTLSTLYEWLGTQTRDGKIREPLLLVDDEADNASINTSRDPKKTTTINGHIRQILSLFERSTYVGYTATPFANIFIDPDTPEEMEHDDLFPRHFIKALEPPTNYVGARRMFLDSSDGKGLEADGLPTGDLRDPCLVEIDDHDTVLPLSHARDLVLDTLPESLYDALRTFVLLRTMRRMDRDAVDASDVHCSMMINVSRFNDVQVAVDSLVRAYLDELRNAIDVHGGRGEGAVESSPLVAALKASFEKHLGTDSELDFHDVLPRMKRAMSSIEVRTVNMLTKGDGLDYSARKESGGLQVIAIGGLALSRGLTLEGLCVSYILRNTAASDTLLQMARWFGYRDGYERLCRVWLPEESRSHYQSVTRSMEELRDEIDSMSQVEATPLEFGLKVRQSETGILVTARNKMRQADTIRLSPTFAGMHVEAHRLRNDTKEAEANWKTVEDFIRTLGPVHDGAGDNVPSHGWREVEGKRVLELLGNFHAMTEHFRTASANGREARRSPLEDYVGERLSTELSLWDVAISEPRTGGGHVDFGGHKILPRKRATGTVSDGCYLVTGKKNRVADPLDYRYFVLEALIRETAGVKGQEKVVCARRDSPLLLIHVIRPSSTDGTSRLGEHAVALSVCLPSTKVPSREGTYVVNRVLQKQIELALVLDDDEIGNED